MALDATTIIGSVGVFMLLLAFFLNIFNFTNEDKYFYIILNVIGSGTACISSILIDYMPFVILEGAWCFVSIVALIRKIKNNVQPIPSKS